MCSMIAECQHGRRRVQNSPKVVKWLKIALKSGAEVSVYMVGHNCPTVTPPLLETLRAT